MYIFTESSNMKSFQYKYWFQYHLHIELYVNCNLMCKNAFLEKEMGERKKGGEREFTKECKVSLKFYFEYQSNIQNKSNL